MQVHLLIKFDTHGFVCKSYKILQNSIFIAIYDHLFIPGADNPLLNWVCSMNPGWKPKVDSIFILGQSWKERTHPNKNCGANMCHGMF